MNPKLKQHPKFGFAQCHFSLPCSVLVSEQEHVLEQIVCSSIPASDMRFDLQSSVELNSHSEFYFSYILQIFYCQLQPIICRPKTLDDYFHTYVSTPYSIKMNLFILPIVYLSSSGLLQSIPSSLFYARDNNLIMICTGHNKLIIPRTYLILQIENSMVIKNKLV